MAAFPETLQGPDAYEAPWNGFHRRWRRLQPPLRPHADVCSALGVLLAGHNARVLLLGVTPELADMGTETVAIDWSDSALTHIWPGNGATRRAVQADWHALPCADGSFSAAIGDGSLSCLEYPSGYHRIFRELSRAVRPGGRIAIRMYVTPDRGESLGAVQACALAGEVGSIHALKWRIANAVCAARGEPNIPVRDILDAFNRGFPDREALSTATGWSEEDIAQVDAFRSLPDVFSFPTLRQVLSILPDRLTDPRLSRSGGYELAERCPLLVVEVRA